MMSFSAGRFLALIVCSCFASMADSSEIPRTQYLDSVAAILSEATLYNGETEHSGGSGFVVSNNGELLTALHVTGNPDLYEKIKLKIYFPKIARGKWVFQGPYSARVKEKYPEYDLALVQLDDISYAAALPVMGLKFIDSMDVGDSLSGLGYNVLPDPPKNFPPSLISAKFSNPLGQPPFGVVEERSLNNGTSGGPLFGVNDDLVTAVWHGRFSSYVGIGGQIQPLTGMSLIIPLTSQVRSWLAAHKVAFSEKRPEYEFPDINGTSEIEIDSNRLKLSVPNDPGSRLFVAAPFGTEVIDAKYESIASTLRCEPGNYGVVCGKTLDKQMISLKTESGRVAYADPPLREGKIRLTLKRAEKAPSFLLQTVAFEAKISDAQNEAQELVRFQPNENGSVLAANVSFDKEHSNIKEFIENGAFVVSSVPERRSGFGGVLYRVFFKDSEITEASTQVIRGTAVLVIGERGANITAKEINTALNFDPRLEEAKPAASEKYIKDDGVR
jgi:hypothetical protein